MKRYPPRRPARHVRVPAFVPVPGRARHDGWTARRQARFLAALALTRSVAAAARAAGMARESAYRLRARAGAESFAAAWDAVLGRAPGKRKITPEERAARALGGLLKPQIWRGQHVATSRKADNSALLALLNQFDRACRECAEEDERSQGFATATAVHAAPPAASPGETGGAPLPPAADGPILPESIARAVPAQPQSTP